MNKYISLSILFYAGISLQSAGPSYGLRLTGIIIAFGGLSAFVVSYPFIKGFSTSVT